MEAGEVDGEGLEWVGERAEKGARVAEIIDAWFERRLAKKNPISYKRDIPARLRSFHLSPALSTSLSLAGRRRRD
jgi:hypothetical protein